MLKKTITLVITVGMGCAMMQLTHAQGMGFGSGEGLPEFQITNLAGDLYRFRNNRHFGMFLVTPEGIILVDPTNSRVAPWLREQLDEKGGLKSLDPKWAKEKLEDCLLYTSPRPRDRG